MQCFAVRTTVSLRLWWWVDSSPRQVMFVRLQVPSSKQNALTLCQDKKTQAAEAKSAGSTERTGRSATPRLLPKQVSPLPCR